MIYTNILCTKCSHKVETMLIKQWNKKERERIKQNKLVQAIGILLKADKPDIKELKF